VIEVSANIVEELRSVCVSVLRGEGDHLPFIDQG
jgi:hypothetical protein